MEVLLIDCDTQGNLAVCLGIEEPDNLEVTLVTALEKVVNDEPMDYIEGILHHEEGVDYLPANIELAGLEMTLVEVQD